MSILYTVLNDDGEQRKSGLSCSGGTALVIAACMAAVFSAGVSFGHTVPDGPSDTGLRSGAASVKESIEEIPEDRGEHPEETPCSMGYWKRKIAEEDDELTDLTVKDMGFIYQSFSIGGSDNGVAKNDESTKTLDREVELQHSVACLKKTLPGISHKHNFLGDFPSYSEGVKSIHAWAKEGKSPYAGTFFIDSDVVANPWSKLHPNLLSWALQNVDLALVYNPNRAKGYERENFKKNNFLKGQQDNGLQGGFFAYRNTTRAKLFHGCVEYTLQQSIQEGQQKPMKQQRAINTVLQSPVGQFVRTHWLPPEFQCWIGGGAAKDTVLSEYEIPAGYAVVARDTKCFFIHTHYVGGFEACM